MGMFCYQCEQTVQGKGCTVKGVCGKEPSTSSLQDLLIYQLHGLGWLANEGRKNNVKDEAVDKYIIEALFTTVTNVNFYDATIISLIQTAEKIKTDFIAKLKNAGVVFDNAPASVTFTPASSDAAIIAQGEAHSIPASQPNEDIRSLQQLLVLGLKGLAAYADHAYVLGRKDEAIFAFVAEALAALNKENPTVDEMVALNMKCGQVNIRTMEILDDANTGTYGHPEPTKVSTAWKAGPAIVVSGHDLLDLEQLLKQTDGTGVNIYTHGEMLPAHGYPELKKYQHLVGHFGTAWQNQQKEFDNVPAAFLFTTNCIQKPRESYSDRVFTCGLVQFPGCVHVVNKDFSAVINKAKALGGLPAKDGITLTTGFARNTVMSVAGTVIDAVKAGAIKHFFLVGGCDGAKPGRNYYTEFVEKTPKDTVVLTLACGKFRFNHLDIGEIGGIPRLLDVGQCNDAYSAVKIALALADAFKCGVNDLPLSFILSWYEQKAVVILLSLLSLGIKNIRLGPTLPAFVTPNILNFLVENFNIMPITTPDQDLAAILKK
ncbi:MAG: hydroxylamine reductase [Chitinispirillaceae bacterium]|nr:hydroxylamine reductase [Chitinispirillaceae bacterium]